ncbi:MAG TPA: flagellar basal body rod protein FlgB [Opitutaceae bacterium]|nr:flagellar basal body rod protein FlgB [Opitutaceae bacterium]
MIDPIFKSDQSLLAGKLLDAAVMRQQAIASNIANAETPGYHRLDVSKDFATQLRAQFQQGKMDLAETLKPTLTEDTQARSMRPDGNSVEMEHELLEMNRNTVEYNFLTDIVSSNFKQLKVAINGVV